MNKKYRNISKLKKLKTRIATLEGVKAYEHAEELNKESTNNANSSRNQKYSCSVGPVFGDQ